ncbi:helix-turn-helix domain-containing protein [Vreelandella populi]|uniref:helix-turn-helix domain-containing protein n=1 Tax=Vreelandella populi TaxID=2498858 RepID=UPI000F8E8860|nr:helix-turn-helix domain-containing protein [Halomonas populi]RUR38515.1 helix-turn-helix domain-containing protein [Halomonas populi]
MSMMLMVKAFGVKVGNASRKLVLIKLADNANDKGECWPSYQHIADQCEISKRSAMKHIDALCESGLVIKRSRKGVKGNSTNIYLLNLEGEISAPLKVEGEQDALEGEESALGSENSALGGSEESAPGISHSFESVNEPSSEPVAPDAEAPVAAGNVVAIRSADKPRCAIPKDMPGPKDPDAKTFKAWANYAITYRRRYTVYPIWNQKTAGQMGQLVDRVGKDLAPAVAAYYLSMNNQFYVNKHHPVGSLLADCEAIATQMQTGSQMTQTRARQMDSTQSNLSNVDEAKRLLASGWGDD